jgi:hypothetical protein
MHEQPQIEQVVSLPEKYQELAKRHNLTGFLLMDYEDLVRELLEISGGKNAEQIAEMRDIHLSRSYAKKLAELKSFLQEKPINIRWGKKDESKLSEIEKKVAEEKELTDDDLRYLYFSGYSDKINTLLVNRNKKSDLVRLIGCRKEQISLTKEEALAGGIVYHYGYLFLIDITSAGGLKLPQTVGGGLYLNSITSADGLKLPQTIVGNLDLRRITSADGLKLPQTIGGNLYLNSITSADGLKLPQAIGGYIYLGSLPEADKEKLREKYPQHASKI